MKRIRSHSGRKAFAISVLLAFALLAFSASHLLYEATYDFGRVGVLAAIQVGDAISGPLGTQIFRFVATLVFVHLLFGLMVYVLATLTFRIIPATDSTLVTHVLGWFALLSLWLLLENAAAFPNADSGRTLHGISIKSIGAIRLVDVVRWSCIAGIVAALAIGSIRLASLRWLLFTGSALSLAAVSLPGKVTPSIPLEPALPHVIVIGIDSLRPDYVFPKENISIVPQIEKFARSSHVFTDTITPLARTFPSWVSILTGRHPHSTGALINLAPRAGIHADSTLPGELKKAGYHTIYAIDEVRFSNVDTSYGFDQQITPPIGAADFLIGELNDFPLSNLAIKSRAGLWLFPHNFANRGAASKYDPDEFVGRLEREISFDRPTLLAVHLTLAHWPFYWSDSEVPDRRETPRQDYERAIKRVDLQFASLLELLRNKGALGNAIVVLLSDHGEALSVPAESLLVNADAALQDRIPVVTGGHGTSVLAPNQYRTLLSFRGMGLQNGFTTKSYSPFPATLEDIAPTLLHVLGLEIPPTTEGHALLACDRILLCENSTATPQVRYRFTETESTKAPVVAGARVPSSSEVARTAGHYLVNPTSGRLELRAEFLGEVIRDREFAVMDSATLLAAIPRDGGRHYDFVAASLDGSWSKYLGEKWRTNDDPRLTGLASALHIRFPALPIDTSPLDNSQ